MNRKSKRDSIYRSPAGAESIERRYRALLDQWPVQHQRQAVPTREGDTFVVSSGPPDAPAVLAIQGSGANSARWLPRIAGLAQHLRVHAIDVIGEPGLSAPSRPPMTSDSYALWLDDVMDGLGLTSARVIGESLGGWFALDYAIRRPERVTRLVLLTPSGIGRKKYGILLKFLVLNWFGDRGRRKAFMAVAGPGARTEAGSNNETELAAFTMVIFKHFKPRMQAIPVFTDEQLRGLPMPVLAIVGERDVMIDSRQTARRLSEALPQATVNLLPDAGHLLPDQTGAIVEFLIAAQPGQPAETSTPTTAFIPH